MGKQYRIMRKQGIGGIGDVLVKVGDEVRKGTLLTTANGLGSELHASVDGVITSIDDTAIIIDANDVQQDGFVPLEKKDNVLDMIKAAGIVGMGGAGFPTHVKMNVDVNGGVLYINSVECEPFLHHNIDQLEEEPELIRTGALYAMKVVNAAKVCLAIKAKNKRAIDAFRAVIQPGDPIEIVELKNLYPMGEERAIIREAQGVLLGIDQLPSAANAVVSNLETIASIAHAVDDCRPVISKNLTVIGKIKGGKIIRVFNNVPIGTPISDLIDAVGGMPNRVGEVIIGGPFTGRRAVEGDTVTKTTGAIIITDEFAVENDPLGLLVCACGANEARLRQMAESMGAKVVGVEFCKQAKEVKPGVRKCENPGNCPGQAERILNLRKAGAKAVLISNCTDCTNTVMGSAPKLGMTVHHCTDHVMRTMDQPVIRRMEL